jgi:hypothetical protein
LGYVRRVSVRVTEPYTGADSDPLLYVNLVAGLPGVAPAEVLRVSLRQRGYAETTLAGTFSDPPARGIQRLALPAATRRLELWYRQAGSAMSGTVAQMPKLAIEVEVEPIGA